MNAMEILDKFVVTKEMINDLETNTLTPQVKVLLEQAYRRGYFHGASNCLQYSKTRSHEKLATWIDEKVESWYCGSNLEKIEPPTP